MLLNNLAKVSRSSRNVVSSALIVIAAIAMYNWLVAPHTAYLLSAQRNRAVVDDIAEKSKVINSTVTIKKNRLQQLREQFAQLQSTFFTVEEAKEFFSDLQAISEQTGCVVNSLNFITDRKSVEGWQQDDSSGIVAQSATLSVVGVYENIIKLVERLQLRAQKVWVDSVEMKILHYDSAQPKCDITITIYTIEDREAGQ